MEYEEKLNALRAERDKYYEKSRAIQKKIDSMIINECLSKHGLDPQPGDYYKLNLDDETVIFRVKGVERMYDGISMQYDLMLQKCEYSGDATITVSSGEDSIHVSADELCDGRLVKSSADEFNETLKTIYSIVSENNYKENGR